MPSNKFTRNKRLRRTPPVCRKPPLPPPPYPYSPPAAGEEIATEQFTNWAQQAHLPALPTPPFNSIAIRNLAYNVYPNAHNPGWISNLRQIRQRWSLFNGRRVIAIAQDKDTIPPPEIMAQLGPDAEYIVHPNNPRTREQPGFVALIYALQNCNPNEATFYAHTQGTTPYHNTHRQRQLAKTFWRNRMYHELLDNWPAVAHELQTHATAGIYLIDYTDTGQTPPESPTGGPWGWWHYCGTFFWFRHDHVYRNPRWSMFPDDCYAPEMWLGSFLPSRLAATLHQPYHQKANPQPDYYDPKTHVDPIDDIPF